MPFNYRAVVGECKKYSFGSAYICEFLKNLSFKIKFNNLDESTFSVIRGMGRENSCSGFYAKGRKA
jgi:hypothetical protein